MQVHEAVSNPHVHKGALKLYAQALLSEKLYISNIFENKEIEDVPICETAKDVRNNPQPAWAETFKIYPYIKQAVVEVEKQINIPGYFLGGWQIIDAITWAIEYEPEDWRSIIYGYEVEFLGRKSAK